MMFVKMTGRGSLELVGRNFLRAGAMALLLAAPLASCQKEEGPAEEAGKTLDKAAQKAADSVGEAAKDVNEGVKDAAQEVKEGAEKTAEKVEDAAKEATTP